MRLVLLTLPVFCPLRIRTNSAGLTGAKPTTMLTIPCLMSFRVVVEESHLTKVDVLGGDTDEGAFSVQVVQEVADFESNPGPCWLLVGLENRPLRPQFDRLLQEKSRPPHRDVLSLRA